jgi:hypothetical protein
MSTHKVTVELSTEATLEVFRLEGRVISLTKTLDNVYRASITNFPIDGDLNYAVFCSGWDPTPWTLKIDVDGVQVTNPPIQGVIEKGTSVDKGDISIS